MRKSLEHNAQLVMETLNQIPGVQKCMLYGSVAEKRADELSDIDIEADVSGLDNGAFILKLPELLKEKLQIWYTDYAPSLAPEQYVVSLALDEQNPFLIADIRCSADPHSKSISRNELSSRNHPYTHMLKLWTANLKHYARGNDCADDIRRMAAKLGIEQLETPVEMLEKVLEWLENNVPEYLGGFLTSCRREWEKIRSGKPN